MARKRFEPATYTPEDLFRTTGSGLLRFDVPPFQRDYSWDEARWRDLWRDVARKAIKTGGTTAHFLGVVLLQDVSGGTASKVQVRVIDGQQRLLTLTALLAALRDEGCDIGVDPFSVAHKARWSGVKPDTEVALKRMGAGEFKDEFPRDMLNQPVAQAYRYFRCQLRLGRPVSTDLANRVERPVKSDEAWEEWPELLPGQKKWSLAQFRVAVTKQLVVVGIHLPPEEQEATGVFESLNGANTQLHEFDKMRVLLYTRAGGESGDYEKLFVPAERQLLATTYRGKVKSVGDQFLYDYSLVHVKSVWDGVSPSALRTHEALKEHALRVAPQDKDFVPKVLKPIVRAASVFPIAVGADEALVRAVRTKEIGYKDALAIRAITGYTSGPPVPLVMRVLLTPKLSPAERTKRLRLIESMLMRCILARTPLSPMRSDLIRLLHGLDETADSTELRAALKQLLDGLDVPPDSELKTMAGESGIFAGDGRVSKTALAQLLRSVEHTQLTNVTNLLPSGGGKDAYTIEHIFPQTENITAGWKKEFKSWGRDAADLSDAWALRHALGNLILLKRSDNSGFGTKSFTLKKQALASSTEQLLMYATVVHKQMWTSDQIEARGKSMAAALLKARPL